MLKRKLSVGSQIDAWCGTCKAERSHTIAAIDPDGSINRVTCEHCNGYHRYRAPAAAAATKTRRTASAKSAAMAAAPRVVRNYARGEKYTVGEVIEHPKH